MIALVDTYTKEELSELVKECFSYRDLMRALGYTINGASYKTIKKRIENYNISVEHFGKGKIRLRTDKELFVKGSNATQKVLRERYLKRGFTPYCCQICNLPPYWNMKPLNLTLDHIDGDNTNNEISNLRWVCPNCDRQLPTFGRKNQRRV